MPVFVLVLAMLVAEVAVIVAVGEVIGGLVTILLLIAVSVVGVVMLRRQGLRTLTAFTEAVRNRRDPQPELVDGVLIGIAAGFVLFPGFLTDVAALLLLFPPTRAVLRGRVLRGVARHVQARQTRTSVFVVDAEVVQPDERRPMVIDAVEEPPRRDR